MSKKTKCCKKYKRGGKYCRGCPLLKRGGQIEKTDSRRATNDFLASGTKAHFNAETLTGRLYKPEVCA